MSILTQPVNFPVGGNRSARRKPTTFGRALTDSFHVRPIARIEPTTPAVKGACLNDCATAMLYQIIDYVQLELLEVPLSLTCTQVLQKWNVPHGEASDDAVLFEDIAFKKSSYLKDKKRKHRNENNLNYNPTTSNHQVTETDIKTLVSGLECNEKAQYLCNILQSNNFQPVLYNEKHSQLPSKKRCTDSLQPNLNDSHVRAQILGNLKGTNFSLANIPPEKVQCATNLEVTYEQMLEIELNARGQASCERWYNERKHQITASNFGTVLAGGC